MTVRDFDPRSPASTEPSVGAPCDVTPTLRDAKTRRAATAHRYAAVVAALIDVRPDEASQRFDGEVANALADHRIDQETARTLRWWQRAAVRAAESYATAIVPQVLAMRDEADAHAMAEADEAAASWAAASAAKAAPTNEVAQNATAQAKTTVAVDREIVDPQAAEPVAKLAAVPFLATGSAAPKRAQTSAHRGQTTEETRRAVRAALALVATDPEAAVSTTSTTTDVAATIVTMLPNERKERRHADPATFT